MAARTDTFDLATLALTPGEARRLELEVALDPLTFGDDSYAVEPSRPVVAIDASRMVGGGWALRLRFISRLRGPCMRCLRQAEPEFEIDAREVDQQGEGEELESPYLSGEVLDVSGWARDALALAIPGQIVCRADCLGLCAICGADLNDEPGHEHERRPDPRWDALRRLELD